MSDRLIITEAELDPANQQPGINITAADLEPNYQPTTLDNGLRVVDATAGYANVGLMLLSTPNTWAQATGAALVAKGTQDVLAVSTGQERPESWILDTIRDGYMKVGSALASNKSGGSWSQRLKRNTGQDMLSFKDQVYARLVNRVAGNAMLTLAGAELITRPSVGEKIAGVALAGLGLAQQAHNIPKTYSRYKEIN